jgi:hypothetical protein
MRKLILTENQYGRLKNLIIESEITKSFLIEQNITINDKKGFVTLNKDLKFKVKDEYDREKEIEIVGNNTKLYPTPKGNVGGEVLIKMTNVGFQGSKNYAKTKVYFMCKTSELMTGKLKYKITDKNLVSEICKSVEIKKNISKTFGVSSVGGGEGYTQKYDQKLKSDTGKELTIPKGTGFGSKKDGSGASFRIANQYGWFDCKTKNFLVDKVKYTNQVLADEISKSICKTTDAVNKLNVGGNLSVGGGGKPSTIEIPQEFDLYI